MGVLPFHLAIQPYVKNYAVFGCPSDPDKQNADIDRSGVRDMFISAGVPGAASLPPYGNNQTFHQAVAKIFPMSYATNYILSQVYGYTSRTGAAVPSSDPGTARGRSLAQIEEPANTWIMTEYGIDPATGNGGYYCTPGYLNGNASLHDRWRKGRRHKEGRHWLFVDGHVKWIKDPAFESSPGVAVPDSQILAYYNNSKVYTTPN